MWQITYTVCVCTCMCVCVCTNGLSPFSCVWLFATPWMLIHQAPLSMWLSQQEYWGGWSCPPPEDHTNPGIKTTFPASPALQVDSLSLSHQGCIYVCVCVCVYTYYIICWWALGLLPCLGYSKCCYCEHWVGCMSR